MTAIRKAPSGPFIEVASGDANIVRYALSGAVIPILTTGSSLFAQVVPVPLGQEARAALAIISLGFLNAAGFDGAPCGGNVGLTQNISVPYNMGGFRFNPVGPGVAGSPLLWTAVIPLVINPGDTFDLFASTNTVGGNVADAAAVTPAPSAADGYSQLSFFLL